jgi:DUF218 domain
MPKVIFILGAPNSSDGKLSLISLSRIDAAVAKQREASDVILLATGGFGAHFNQTDTPHRELVYRQLEARGATIDRAQPGDLLSSNTVEDIALIVAFANARGIDNYGVLTSRFHAARCQFIVDCLAVDQNVALLAADDPEELEVEAHEHETRALRQLLAQGGVTVGNKIYPHRAA